MLYVFVRPDGTVAKRQELSSPPPTVAPSKGRWLGVVEGAKPAFDPETHELRSSAEIVVDEYHITWQRFPLPPEVVAAIAAEKAEQTLRTAVTADPAVQAFLAMTDAEVQAAINAADTVPKLQLLLRRIVRIVRVVAKGVL